MARWDNVATTVNWPTAGNALWAEWQRAKQYRGDHDETWGGVTLNIDSDLMRGPIATVLRSYRVTSSGTLNVRSGPSSAYPIVGTLAANATVSVICQARGQVVGSTAVWDRISTGGYVSDRYISTPSSTTFSATLLVPGADHHRDARQHPQWSRDDVCRQRRVAGWRPRLRRLPEGRHPRRHDPGVEPARRRPLDQRLLRRQRVEHDLQRARPPLPLTAHAKTSPRGRPLGESAHG